MQDGQCAGSVLTHDKDGARTGQNLNELFARLSRQKSTGCLARPLGLPTVKIPDRLVSNAVSVASEHDRIYAFDADESSVSQPRHVSSINPGR